MYSDDIAGLGSAGVLALKFPHHAYTYAVEKLANQIIFSCSTTHHNQEDNPQQISHTIRSEPIADSLNDRGSGYVIDEFGLVQSLKFWKENQNIGNTHLEKAPSKHITHVYSPEEKPNISIFQKIVHNIKDAPTSRGNKKKKKKKKGSTSIPRIKKPVINDELSTQNCQAGSSHLQELTTKNKYRKKEIAKPNGEEMADQRQSTLIQEFFEHTNRTNSDDFDDEPRDGSKNLGHMARENGRFGSYPLHDDYDDESDAD